MRLIRTELQCCCCCRWKLKDTEILSSQTSSTTVGARSDQRPNRSKESHRARECELVSDTHTHCSCSVPCSAHQSLCSCLRVLARWCWCWCSEGHHCRCHRRRLSRSYVLEQLSIQEHDQHRRKKRSDRARVRISEPGSQTARAVLLACSENANHHRRSRKRRRRLLKDETKRTNEWTRSIAERGKLPIRLAAAAAACCCQSPE